MNEWMDGRTLFSSSSSLFCYLILSYLILPYLLKQVDVGTAIVGPANDDEATT